MTTSNEHNNAPAVLEQELSALLTTSLPYMTPVGRARLGQDIAQLYSSVSAPAVAQGEPVVWQARCVWPNGRKSTKWSLVTATNAELTPKMRAEYLARLTHPDGSPSYEVRALYAATPAPAPAQEVGLTDEEIEAIAKKHMSTVGDHWCNEEAIREIHAEDFARAIIAALLAKWGQVMSALDARQHSTIAASGGAHVG